MATSYEHQINVLLESFGFNYTKRSIQEVYQTKAASKQGFINDVLTGVQSSTELKTKLVELGMLNNHMGTRQVEVFNVTVDSLKANINSYFNDVRICDVEPLNSAFPFPLENKSDLNHFKKNNIFVMDTSSKVLGGIEYQSIVLSTIVEKDIEKTVSTDFVTEAGKEFAEQENTQFFFKTKQQIQLFHVVYWNCDESRLIISVERDKISHSESQDQLFLVRNLLSKSSIDLGNALNVFGAIDPLYKDDDGYIIKLGHVTVQSNPVKIQLKGKEKCLKQDRYHSSGENSGFVHAKFAVSKRWLFKDEAERNIVLDVELPGKVQMLTTAQPLTDFSVNNCTRFQDLDFAIKNVVPYAN